MQDNYKNQIELLLIINIATCIFMLFNGAIIFPIWEILFFISVIMLCYELFVLLTFQTLYFFDNSVFKIIDDFLDFILPEILVFIILSLFLYSDAQGLRVFLTLYYFCYITSFICCDLQFLKNVKQNLLF